MTLHTRPTREQLTDPSFWNDLSSDGVEHDGTKYVPFYSVLINGELVDFKTNNDEPVINSFPYGLAIKEVNRLSNDRDSIDLKVTSYWQEV